MRRVDPCSRRGRDSCNTPHIYPASAHSPIINRFFHVFNSIDRPTNHNRMYIHIIPRTHRKGDSTIQLIGNTQIERERGKSRKRNVNEWRGHDTTRHNTNKQTSRKRKRKRHNVHTTCLCYMKEFSRQAAFVGWLSISIGRFVRIQIITGIYWDSLALEIG